MSENPNEPKPWDDPKYFFSKPIGEYSHIPVEQQEAVNNIPPQPDSFWNNGGVVGQYKVGMDTMPPGATPQIDPNFVNDAYNAYYKNNPGTPWYNWGKDTIPQGGQDTLIPLSEMIAPPPDMRPVQGLYKGDETPQGAGQYYLIDPEKAAEIFDNPQISSIYKVNDDGKLIIPDTDILRLKAQIERDTMKSAAEYVPGDVQNTRGGIPQSELDNMTPTQRFIQYALPVAGAGIGVAQGLLAGDYASAARQAVIGGGMMVAGSPEAMKAMGVPDSAANPVENLMMKVGTTLDGPAEIVERSLGVLSQGLTAIAHLDSAEAAEIIQHLPQAYQAGSIMYESLFRTQDLEGKPVTWDTDAASEMILRNMRRQLIENPEASPEQLIAEAKSKLGIQGAVQDFFGHMFIDPLNLLGGLVAKVGIKGIEGLSKLAQIEKIAEKFPDVLKFAGEAEKFLKPAIEIGKDQPTVVRTVFASGIQNSMKAEEAARLTGLSRWFAGIDAAGNAKWLDTAKDATFLQKMFGTTPTARAVAANMRIADTVTAITGGEDFHTVHDMTMSMADTPIGKVAEAFDNPVKVDGEPLPSVATGSLAGEAATMALKDFKSVGQRIVDAYDMAHGAGPDKTYNPAMIIDEVAKVIGEKPEQMMNRISREAGTAESENVYKRFMVGLKIKADGGDAQAGRVLELLSREGDFNAGRLKEYSDLFTKNHVPFSEDQAKAQYYAAMYDHINEWAAKHFGVAPDSRLFRFANLMKKAQNPLLLGYNLSYLIQNALSNAVHLAYDGLMGFNRNKDINKRYEEIGFTPSRAKERMDMHGTLEDSKIDAISKAKRQPGWMQTVSDWIGKIPSPMSKLSGEMERIQGNQAMYKASEEYLTRLWTAEVYGIDRFSPELAKALGPDVVSAWESHVKRTMGTNGLVEGQEVGGVTLKDVVDPEYHQVLDAFPDLMAKADYELQGCTTKDEAAAVIERTLVDALNAHQDEVRKSQEYVAETTNQRVQMEGMHAITDIYGDGASRLEELQVRHFDRMEQTAKDAEAAPDKKIANMIWTAAQNRERREFNAEHALYKAEFGGMLKAVGLKDESAVNLMKAIDDTGKLHSEYFERKSTRQAEHFGKDYKNKEESQAAWAEIQKINNSEYEDLVVKEHENQAIVDSILTDKVRTQYGDQAADAFKSYRENVALFREIETDAVRYYRAGVNGEKLPPEIKAKIDEIKTSDKYKNAHERTHAFENQVQLPLIYRKTEAAIAGSDWLPGGKPENVRKPDQTTRWLDPRKVRTGSPSAEEQAAVQRAEQRAAESATVAGAVGSASGAGRTDTGPGKPAGTKPGTKPAGSDAGTTAGARTAANAAGTASDAGTGVTGKPAADGTTPAGTTAAGTAANVPGRPPAGTTIGQIAGLDKWFIDNGWTRGRDGIVRAVNTDEGTSYKSWKEVPFDSAEKAINKRKGNGNTPEENAALAKGMQENELTAVDREGELHTADDIAKMAETQKTEAEAQKVQTEADRQRIMDDADPTKSVTRDDYARSLVDDFKLPQEQADDVMTVLDGWADYWKERNGISREDWFSENIGEVRRSELFDENDESSLFQVAAPYSANDKRYQAWLERLGPVGTPVRDTHDIMRNIVVTGSRYPVKKPFKNIPIEEWNAMLDKNPALRDQVQKTLSGLTNKQKNLLPLEDMNGKIKPGEYDKFTQVVVNKFIKDTVEPKPTIDEWNKMIDEDIDLQERVKYALSDMKDDRKNGLKFNPEWNGKFIPGDYSVEDMNKIQTFMNRAINGISKNPFARYMRVDKWNDLVRPDSPVYDPELAKLAREAYEILPEEVRNSMHLRSDGTIQGSELEKKFKMMRSFFQRVVDGYGDLMIDPRNKESLGKGMYVVNGKEIPLSTVNVPAGEEYRRALVKEFREMYDRNELPPKRIGAMRQDSWGALGFIAGNDKTKASGDFTTLCPQVFVGDGCWYCYRRSALESGINNKLVGTTVWYAGEILRIDKNEITRLNANGGLRIQSFGDWQPQYEPMLIDMITDAEKVGLQVKIITKEPGMIDLVAKLRKEGLGLSVFFNLSADYTIEKASNHTALAKNRPYGRLRNLYPDRPEYADDNSVWLKRALSVKEASKYRNEHDFVNTRIVATDVEEFVRGLRDESVDVVTGYHGGKRDFERVDCVTGNKKVEVEPIGDNGMPQFSKDGKLLYPGKTKYHQKLAHEIMIAEDKDALIQAYFNKVCCVTGKCKSCVAICGANNFTPDFLRTVKTARMRDQGQIEYVNSQWDLKNGQYYDWNDKTKKWVLKPAQKESQVESDPSSALNQDTIGKISQKDNAQLPKGSTSWLENGKAVITAWKKSDVSTALHESVHVYLRSLVGVADDDIAVVTKWLRETHGMVDLADDWVSGDVNANRQAHELVARALEEYHAEGKPPKGASEQLIKVFENIKEWMLAIYKQIEGSQIDVQISDEMRALFGKWAMGGKSVVETNDQGVSIPVMITQNMKRQLAGAGFTPEQVREMTPQQAWEAINQAKGKGATVAAKYPQSATTETPMRSVRDVINHRSSDKIFYYEKGLPGKNGNSLVAYQHIRIPGEKYSSYEGGLIRANISDWERAENCASCGRNIVHAYWVRDTEGNIKPYGVEHLHEALGLDKSVTKKESDKLIYELDHQQRKQESRKKELLNYYPADDRPSAMIKYAKANGRAYPGAFMVNKETGKSVRVNHHNEFDVNMYREAGYELDPTSIREEAFKLIEPETPATGKGSGTLYQSAETAGADTQEQVAEAQRLYREKGTESPYFKRFYDGNAPELYDESGKPKPVFHGTFYYGFDTFNTDKGAIFFTDKKRVAQGYSYKAGGPWLSRNDNPQSYEVYLGMKNPLVIDARGKRNDNVPVPWKNWKPKVFGRLPEEATSVREIAAYAKENGYDGLIVQNVVDTMDITDKTKSTVYAVFDSNQVKSVQNRGTFDRRSDNMLLQEGVPEPPLGEREAPNAVNAPVGTFDDAHGDAPHAKIAAEGMAKEVLPMLDRAKARLEDPAIQAKLRTRTKLEDLTPELQDKMRAYMAHIKDKAAETKLGMKYYAEARRDFAMLNYSSRYGLDNWLNVIYPYQFWYTRTMLNWGLRSLTRPAILANYARLMQLTRGAEEREGYPTRLKGKLAIYAPWLPDWMGDTIYIDPYKQIFPFLQITRPWDKMASDRNMETRKAETHLQEMIANDEITKIQADEALSMKSGSAWDKALAMAKADTGTDTDNLLTLSFGVTGPSLPVGIAANLAAGHPEKISQFPATRTIQNITALMGLGGNRGVNIEAAVRKATGLPLVDQYEDYRVDRMLANLTAEGQITPKDAIYAQMNRTGPAFEMAQKRVSQMGFLQYAGSVLNTDLYPEGEERQRNLQVEYSKAIEAWKNGDKTALPNFMEKYPEYQARQMSMKNPEERMRAFLRSEIWDRYMKLPDQNKEDVRNNFGDLFNDAFLNKETRSYDSIDTLTYGDWARKLGAIMPDGVKLPKTPPVKFTDPAIVAKIQEYNDTKDKNFPTVAKLENIYYSIPEEQQAAFEAQNPELKAYNDWRTQFLADNPKAIPFLIGETNALSGLPVAQQAAVYKYRADKNKYFPNIDQMQAGYFNIPTTDRQTRKAYLKAYPQITQYWDWKDQYAAANPKVATYIKSDDAVSKALSGEGVVPANVQRMLDTYYEEKDKRFPNIDQMNEAYYSLTDPAQRKAFAAKYPEVKDYPQWKKMITYSMPEISPYVYEPQTLANMILPPAQAQAIMSKFSPQLSAIILGVVYSGETLTAGAKMEMKRLWEQQGKPLGDFDRFVNALVMSVQQ